METLQALIERLRAEASAMPIDEDFWAIDGTIGRIAARFYDDLLYEIDHPVIVLLLESAQRMGQLQGTTVEVYRILNAPNHLVRNALMIIGILRRAGLDSRDSANWKDSVRLSPEHWANFDEFITQFDWR